MHLEQLLSLCAEQGVELVVDDGNLEVFFDHHPTEALLSALREHKEQLLVLLTAPAGEAVGAEDDIVHAARGVWTPLSSGQQRLWFIDRLQGGSEQYNLCSVLDYRGWLDLSVAEQVLNALVERHAPLRTAIRDIDGEARQQALTAAPLSIRVEELQGMGEAERERRVADALAAESGKGFDLGTGSMLRTLVLRTADDAGVLVLTVHHIAADGWSLHLLVEEFCSLYDAAMCGREKTLAPLTVEYVDFAKWQRERLETPALKRQLAYWATHLKGLPQVHGLVLDRPRPPQQDFAGAVETLQLPASTVQVLDALCQAQHVTPFMVLHAVFSILLSRYSREHDIVIGTPIANRRRKEFEPLVGYFANTLVLRTEVDDSRAFSEHLHHVLEVNLAAQEYQDLPFEVLVEHLNPARSQAHAPLFQVMLAMNTTPAVTLDLPGLQFAPRALDQVSAKYELTLHAANEGDGLALRFEYQSRLFDRASIATMARRFAALLDDVLAHPERRLDQLQLMTAQERRQLLDRLSAPCARSDDELIHGLFERRAAARGDAVAVEHGENRVSYAELNARANQLAHYLREQGAAPGQLVGVCVERSIEMVVSLLAILKAGAAYVPLDPDYPLARLDYMLSDSGATLLLTQSHLADQFESAKAHPIRLDDPAEMERIGRCPQHNPPVDCASRAGVQLAYTIYTSGSSGQPKGVMVEHGSVVSFLHSVQGMIGGESAVWLGLTAISFDISVLELFGSLLHGGRLVLASSQGLAGIHSRQPAPARSPLDFSLFYFASAAHDANADIYRLLLEGARFADANGFSAVWTPERHFSRFGGVFPNPAVTGAAIAASTSRVQIRAGSCVLPLNDPLRIAEDWSVVDNLSDGRVGLAFASGWNPNDFVLAPDNFAQRHELLEQGVETFRRFWAGEAVSRVNGNGKPVSVQLYPQPRQSMPPLWITAAGSEQTFVLAGRLGLKVLTHLLGQTTGELAAKIIRYREAWQAAGHAGECGVSLMLHTYIAESDEEALEVVRQPFKDYLATSLTLMNDLRREFAGVGGDGAQLDADTVLEYAFNRYFKTAALFGSTDRCAVLIRELQAIGVSELACLIDFGVGADLVLEALPRLAALRDTCTRQDPTGQASIGELVARHGVTHMQCTPSHAAVLVADDRQQLRGLRGLLVGGEAFPAALAQQLRTATDAQVHNMYGPTEATVWTSAQPIGGEAQEIAIGYPLPGYGMYVVGRDLQILPPGMPGELLISGTGVARGYLNQDKLTAERFIEFSPDGEARMRAYRSGDLVRQLPNGAFQFLGRIDSQVKLRGFRIELGEIEAKLREHPDVKVAACAARAGSTGEMALFAYVVPYPGAGMSERQLDNELREMLTLALPGYMLPAAITVLDKLPMTPNGKLDRGALPTPRQQVAEVRSDSFIAPITATERALVCIWADLLRIEERQIGADSRFFDLGGHSLLLMRLLSEVNKRFNLSLTIRDVFEASTLGELASKVEASEGFSLDNSLDSHTAPAFASGQ